MASPDDAREHAEKVWPSSPLLYSMFDERVGEFPKHEVRKFIGSLKRAGYAGARIQDYSSNDSDRDADTLAVFDPHKSVEIVDHSVSPDALGARDKRNTR